jgi:hypothetical protein
MIRPAGVPRYQYDRHDKTIRTSKRTWSLKDVPPHVMYEWIREDWVFKGVLVDWLAEKVFWKRTG